MVKGPLRLLAIIILVVPMSACVVVMSVFPATLSQIVARADLSAVIPANTGSQYQPFIVTPSGSEFVILMRTNSGPDPVTIVMDSNLKVIQTYSLSQLNGWGPPPFDTTGRFLMSDAAGNVAISNFAFSANELATVNLNPSWVTNPTLNSQSFCSPTAQKNDINFQITGGNSLSYAQWQWWASQDFPPPPVAIAVNGAGGNYNVVAVYNVDDTPAAGEVVLVLSDMGNNMYFVAIPLFNILNNTVASPLFGSYPYTTLSNVSNSSIGFAGDSLVVYNYNSTSLVRYSAKPPFNQLGSLSLGNNNGNNKGTLQYAYKMTGGYCVVYDSNARTLTKAANWW